MIQVDVVFGGRSVADVQQVADKQMLKAVEHSLDQLQKAALAAASFRNRTGRLRSAVETRVLDATHGEVYINERIAPHGPFIHEGTGIHGPKGQATMITSEKGKRLHWTEGGREFFASRVVNPGIEGDPFLYEAYQTMSEKLEATYNNAIEKVFEELGL